MTTQKRDYTLEARFKIPLITDARLLSCRLLRNPPQLEHIREEQAVFSSGNLDLSRPPPPPSARPHAAQGNVHASRPPPPPSMRARQAENGHAPGTSRPPPPPSMRAAQKPPSVRPEPESSVMVSLAELQRIGAERRDEGDIVTSKPPPAQRQAAVSESSSVMVSLTELQRLEGERVAEERRKQEEAELAKLEDQIKELEVKEARDRLLDTLTARIESERARIDSECEELGRQEAQAALDEQTDALIGDIGEGPAEKEESLEIHIEEEFGLPWDDEHGVYRMTENELTIAAGVLPEREVLWVLPVPPSDTTNPAELSILEKFGRHQRARLNGKSYYVTDDTGIFANSRKVARVGDTLHVWPSATTDYDYIGEADLLDRTAPARWPERFNYVELSDDELAECSNKLPDGRPRWLHPVPSFESRFEEDVRVLTAYPLASRVLVRGREYMVLDIVTMADWQNAVKTLPKCRIATRNGRHLSVLDESENGRDMFFSEKTFHSDYYGEPGETIDAGESYIKPYDSEDIQVWLVYNEKEKWLMPMPDNLADMNSNELHFIVQVCNQRAGPDKAGEHAQDEADGVSPLISLAGRWYAALPLAAPGTRRTAYDSELRMVHVLPDRTGSSEVLNRMRQSIRQKVEDGKELEIILPSQQHERMKYLRLFPAGEPRYLFAVDPTARDYKPVRPHIELTRRDGSVFRCIVLEEPYSGAICVERRGSVIKEVDSDSIPPEYKDALARVSSSGDNLPKTGENTTEEVTLEPGSGEVFVMRPVEKQKWGGNDPSD
jgi:hypothetical protein